MRVSRLLGKNSQAQPKSRYAIVADGGRDPESVAPVEPAALARLSGEGGVGVAPPPSTEGAATGVGTGGPGLDELEPEELERRRAALDELVAMMRPAVQMDGGDLEVVDVDYGAGVVEVELQGACGSCAISATTLQGGVERLLKERLDWVTEVRGGVDDSVDPLESAAMGRGAYVPRYY